MKKIILSTLILILGTAAYAGSGDDSRDTTLKTFSIGLRGVHLFDLPSYRYDTPLTPDMRGLNGSKTRFDMGFDVYAEKQFTPLLGVQAGFRYASITGANDVEYYENTFTQGTLDAVFILSNLDLFHKNSPWNFYAKAGLGYGSFQADQYLIMDDAPENRVSENFWETHIGGGIQYELNTFLRLELESSYHIAQNDGFDGYDHNTGSDPYLSTALGVAYTFGRKDKKPMYATNYFGEEYVAADAVPAVEEPREPEVTAEELEELKAGLEEQQNELRASKRQAQQQQKELDAMKDAIKNRKTSLAVYFEFDSKELSRSAKVELWEEFGDIEPNGSPQLELIAYADNNGSSEYNEQLKQKRAESVKAFLVETLGWAAENITISKGEASELSFRDQFLNRKVVIRY